MTANSTSADMIDIFKLPRFSIKVPLNSLGCANITGIPCAPTRGSLSSSLTFCEDSASLAAAMSGTRNRCDESRRTGFLPESLQSDYFDPAAPSIQSWRSGARRRRRSLRAQASPAAPTLSRRARRDTWLTRSPVPARRSPRGSSVQSMRCLTLSESDVRIAFPVRLDADSPRGARCWAFRCNARHLPNSPNDSQARRRALTLFFAGRLAAAPTRFRRYEIKSLSEGDLLGIGALRQSGVDFIPFDIGTVPAVEHANFSSAFGCSPSSFRAVADPRVPRTGCCAKSSTALFIPMVKTSAESSSDTYFFPCFK